MTKFRAMSTFFMQLQPSRAFFFLDEMSYRGFRYNEALPQDLTDKSGGPVVAIKALNNKRKSIAALVDTCRVCPIGEENFQNNLFR